MTHDGQPHKLAVGRLTRSLSYRSDGNDSPPGPMKTIAEVTLGAEAQAPPKLLQRPRLKRNVTFDHMPRGLLDEGEDGEGSHMGSPV